MTDSALPLRGAIVTRQASTTVAGSRRHALADVRAVRIPAHIGVMIGLTAGTYAVALAMVTGLQSTAEATLGANRAPALASIEGLQRNQLALAARLTTAAKDYGDAAAAYSVTGAGLTEMQSRLTNLAGLIAGIDGAAANLPANSSLPAVSRSVGGGAAPAVHATTTASGG